MLLSAPEGTTLLLTDSNPLVGLLLRPYALDDVAAAPVLINRVGHPDFCANWLILGALVIYLDPARARRPAPWAAVLGLAALIHSYLLLTVAAIWATAMLCAAVREPGRLRLLGGAALIVGVVATALSLHDLSGERFGSTDIFGRFAMTLDA